MLPLPIVLLIPPKPIGFEGIDPVVDQVVDCDGAAGGGAMPNPDDPVLANAPLPLGGGGSEKDELLEAVMAGGLWFPSDMFDMELPNPAPYPELEVVDVMLRLEE